MTGEAYNSNEKSTRNHIRRYSSPDITCTACRTDKNRFSPVDAIDYENRPAEKLSGLTVSSYLDGSFQDSMEKSLSDQVHFAIKAKKLYNIFDFFFAKNAVSHLANDCLRYIPYKNVCLLGDTIVAKPVSPDTQYYPLMYNSHLLSAEFSVSPDVDFYVYYIEHDADIDFVSGEKTGYFEYLSQYLDIPPEHISRLEISSLDEYRELFLKTDHHWNSRGADKALREICAMMGIDAIPSRGEHLISNCYLGTRAAGLEGFPPEDFSVQLYDYPEMTITANGYNISDYGSADAFIDGNIKTVSYGTVFGQDVGELIFDTGRDGDNLLVLSDSYDNALIKPLAASFSKTYSTSCFFGGHGRLPL